MPLRKMSTVVAALLLVGVLAGGGTAVAAERPEDQHPSAGADTTQPASLSARITEASTDAGADAAGIAREVGLPDDGPGSLQLDAAGAVAVTVAFEQAPTEEQVAAVVAVARVDRVLSFTPSVTAYVPAQRLTDLESISGVLSVTPALQPATGGSTRAVQPALSVNAAPDASCRSIPVEADAPLRTALARERYGVDGSGVTVGIISDSFAVLDTPTSADEDVLAGVLPGPGNPCGHATPVEVIVEGGEWGADEGRAMAQLVHGIAPGARLLFAAGGLSEATMAQSIIELARAGADVIVDDLSYFTETYYQQGILAGAITVAQRDYGVAYFTSAGNENTIGAVDTPSAGLPISSWSTPAFRSVPCPSWVAPPEGVTAFDCLDFDPGPGQDPTHDIGFTAVADPGFLLSWGEPIYGVATELELRVYDGADREVATSIRPNAVVPTALTFPGRLDGDYRLVVVRRDPQPGDGPAVWIGNVRGSDAMQWREYDRSDRGDVVGPMVYGHQGDGSAWSVAAADWATPRDPQSYTSLGPGTVLFHPADLVNPVPSPAYPHPVTVAAPVIAAVDGTRTSFFGSESEEAGQTVYRFNGTSAAAPHMAAVFALGLEYGASRDAVFDAARSSAREMTNPFPGELDIPGRDVFGAGMVDAFAMLDALTPPAVSQLRVVAESPHAVSATWALPAPALAVRVELGTDAGIVQSVTLEAGAAGHTFSGLQPGTEYILRVTTRSPGGQEGPTVTSERVRTPAAPQPVPASAALAASGQASAGLLAGAAGAFGVIAAGALALALSRRRPRLPR